MKSFSGHGFPPRRKSQAILIGSGRLGAAQGDAAGSYEEARGDDAEEKAADVGEVGDAAGSDLGDHAEVEDLDEEPEADEKRRGDVGDRG